MLGRRVENVKAVYHEYPSQFWLVMGASFIDRLGGALVFPFFALYLTAKFDVGLTEVGYLFAIFTVTGIIGSSIGGALTDQFGRKKIILFGLVVSACSSLLFAFVNDFQMIFFVGAFVGLFASIAEPAHQAIIADILPEEQHTEGYGIWRVVANLAVTFGPLIGGFLATYSFVILFVIDAITSVITAIVMLFLLREPYKAKQDEPLPTLTASTELPAVTPKKSIGYMPILRDTPYLAYIFFHAFMTLVYLQMNQTLPVFLRDTHGIPPSGYGYILSMNAAMVVLFQFWITRKIRGRPAFMIMAYGSLLYAIGFGMYGFVSTFPMFLLAMVIITIGEMLTAPVGQSLVAKFAPSDMRGRYMAIYGFSWAIPGAMGLILAGLVTDYIGPNWVWYFSIILSLIAMGGYLWLQTVLKGAVVEDEKVEALPTPGLDVEATPIPG
jgi:MFS family permease